MISWSPPFFIVCITLPSVGHLELTNRIIARRTERGSAKSMPALAATTAWLHSTASPLPVLGRSSDEAELIEASELCE